MSSATIDREVRDTDLPEGWGMLSVPDATGDTRIMWDPRDKDSISTAKAAFEEAQKKGMTAYLVGEGGESSGEVTREFPKKAGKLIMVRQIQGG